MIFVESETEVTFTTKKKLTYGSILMLNEYFSEISYARRCSDGFLIEFDESGVFKSATLNGKHKTRSWADEHNELSEWDIGLRGIMQ